MVITKILEENAEKFPNDIALVEINPEAEENREKTWREFSLIETNPDASYQKEISWKKFDDTANRVANFLMDKGIKKGDKIAILLMNCIEWLPIYFGILKAGALAVPLNYRYTSDEILYCLNKSDSIALIYGREFVSRIEKICDEIKKFSPLIYVGEDCPSFATSYDDEVLKASCERVDMSLSYEDDAALYFSSGTTGFPKAILHSHHALYWSCVTENEHHKQTKEDNFLCIPPLYHTGAKMHWFGSFLVGSKAVLLKGVKPKWILEAVSKEMITIVWLLVPWAQDILDAIEGGEINLKDYSLDQWRLMHIGAQPVPPSLIQRWKKVFPDHDYDTNYGLSESIGPGCVHLGMENIHKVGAIGIPGYGWQTKIVDEFNEEVLLGQVGELAVKGPGLMKCYYKDEAATKEVLKDGWLHTGDMAMQDEDGFIFLVDRKKDVIITGGENIYPVQIEDFMRGHESIKDVAVIGLPDKRVGEIAAAIVEVKTGHFVTDQDMEEFCNGLPRYKRPKVFIFDKVPRNPTGKIEKPKIREKYCEMGLVRQQISN